MLLNNKDTSITVIGDGGWGTTIAIHLAKKGYKPFLWGPFPKYLDLIRRTRQNKKFLNGFKIPKSVQIESDLLLACKESRFIFLAIPSQFVRQTVKQLKKLNLKNKYIFVLSKGFEVKSNKLMSQVLESELGRVSYAIISGPCISREIAGEIPTAAIIASKSPRCIKYGKELLDTPKFVLYESKDVIGAQLGGSIKNVIAIAAGIIDGLGYGTNAKSVLLVRGIAEIVRLAKKMGAKTETFLGLSGYGDLITTGFSESSRNHVCGIKLSKGKKLKSILTSTEMVIEGVESTKSTYMLSKKHKVAMPIVCALYEILFKNKNPKRIIRAVFEQQHITEK